MAILPWPVLNIRSNSMVQKPSPIWMLYLSGYRASTMSHQIPPPPHYRQPFPPSVWQYNRTLVWLNCHTYVKNQRENLYGWGTITYKKLSLIHVCKIGLRFTHWAGTVGGGGGLRIIRLYKAKTNLKTSSNQKYCINVNHMNKLQ